MRPTPAQVTKQSHGTVGSTSRSDQIADFLLMLGLVGFGVLLTQVS